MRHLVMHSTPDAIIRGLREAGMALKLDTDNVIPKTPKKWGTLKRSGVVRTPQKKKDGYSIIVEYTAPYAAQLHENEGGRYKNWTEPGSGPKFLQTKLELFINKYYSIIGKALARTLK